MSRVQVTDSSNVAEITYDDQTQTLQVEFKNGGVYQYFDVPQNIYDAFASAESKGRFLISQIKGAFRYARV